MSDCRNDCIEPLNFPQHPNNRPGLSHIAYRIGNYADFREALLSKLNQSETLKKWTHREADDPGIALLEGASILGDILTFYQELYANEAYLRTAQWRESIADLVRLLGYRLSPGIGGRGIFAFGIKGNKPVIVPPGFPIKAQIKGVSQPVDFQTTTALVAEPTLSQFNLYRPFSQPQITANTKTFSVETTALETMGLKLNKGDRLMLITYPTDPLSYRQIVVVEEIKQKLDLTEITFKGSWQGNNIDQLAACKLGRSFRHFGYNAPPKLTVLEGEKAVQDSVNFVINVGTLFRRTAKSSQNIFLSNLKAFPLDSQVNDLSVGATLLISLQLSSIRKGNGKSYIFARKITKITSASMTVGSLTGGTTVVELDQGVAVGQLIYSDLRSIEIQEIIGQPFILKTVRQPGETSDKPQLFYYGDGDSYQKLDQRLIQISDGTRFESVIVNIDPKSMGNDNQVTLRPLTLNSPLQSFTLADFPLDKPTVTVYGNLVEATQGKQEKEEILGNGDNRQIFQTFQLPKSPLTYLIVDKETPPEVPQLEIWVNNRQWQQVSSLFGHGGKEEIYIVREDANGNSWVQFGDGKTGARLPSGLQNIVVKYRTGIGAYGTLKEETTVQAGDRLANLDKIWLPGLVSGGEQPETGNNAKQAAPGKIQSLGRLVSLKDFESETLGIAGVAKVAATWALIDNIPTVVLTVLMQTGRDKEIDQVESTLNHYNRCRGAQRFPIQVNPGTLQYVYLDVSVGSDPTFRPELVRQGVIQALGVTDEDLGLFSLQQRQFGAKEYATRIEGIIQNVEGVVWVKVTAFGLMNGSDSEPSKLTFPPEPKPLNLVISCASNRILSLNQAHFQLKLAATISQEVC